MYTKRGERYVTPQITAAEETSCQIHETDLRGSHIESLLENLFESRCCSIILIFRGPEMFNI